jgi:alkanesulfonate monooxygenase SsuD/methylene tetrahydromethanopterin reductase-like flavin-dependent oxidoreductase (luciferase family)
MLAKKASTVDEISDGRLILGLGAGWNEPDFRAFGFPFDHRVSRFEEAFTIIRRLLEGETVTFHGQYYDIDTSVLLPKSARERRPPLLIGSIGRRMLEATLPWVDAWNAWYDDFANDPAAFGVLNDQVSAHCEELGRDPLTLRRTASLLVQVDEGVGRPTLYSVGPQAEPIRGSTGEIADRLNAFYEAGAHSLEIVLDPISMQGIEAFAPVLGALKTG